MSQCVEREEEGKPDRPESPSPSWLSMSNWSKGKPSLDFTNEPGPSHKQILAEQTTDDDDWKCRHCDSRNTAEDLKCRRCKSINWSSITALPLSAADTGKSWHKHFSQCLRHAKVRSMVGAMSTGDPAEDIKDLVTDAQNIERNTYESTNSEEEYWDLIHADEKRVELEKGRKKIKQMEMKSTDQKSPPPLPPVDKKEKASGGCKGEPIDTSSSSSSPFLSLSEDDEDEDEGSTPFSVGVYHKEPASLPFHQIVDPQGSVTSQRSLTPPSSRADRVKHGEMEDTPYEKNELVVEGDRRLKQASHMPQDKSLQHSPGEMMSCDTACGLSTTDHPVTESLSSMHPSLELHAETDLSSSFSGLSIESISLPRSHSLTSVSQIPSLENKTSFRSKRSHSVNDVSRLDKTQKMTPDIIVVENKESYRFHRTQAGLFQCSVTGLMFKMKKEGDVTYRTVPWHRRFLAQLGKRPAGPLFDIKCTQGSLCQLHFPHCEILSMGAGKFLSVLHVMDDDGFELIKPHMITETHVIINVTGFSLFGILIEMLYGPCPVQALVSLFYTPPIDDDHPSSILKVLVLPRNVVLSDVLKERRKLNGEEIYIGNPPCKLIPKQEYTLSTCPQDDSIKIQPNKAEFEVDQSSYRDYIETFDVILKRRFSSVSVLLRSSKTSDCPWERDVDLSAAASRKEVQRTPRHEARDKLLSVRSSFIGSVSHPILNNVLDKLFEKGVIIKEEYDEARVQQVKHEKARCVIDTVMSKGTSASLKLMFILRETDPFLSEDLGLM